MFTQELQRNFLQLLSGTPVFHSQNDEEVSLRTGENIYINKI